MKLKINKDSLNKILSFLNTGIPTKSIVPVDQRIMFSFSAEEDRCDIRISNSYVEMSAYIKVDVEEDIEFCLPAHMITRTVATFPDGEIQITPKYNKDGGDLNAIALKPEGQRKSYKIACFPPGDFAKWNVKEEGFSVDISMSELSEKLKVIGSNVDASDIRPQFANIQMIQQDGKMSFISGNNILIGQLVTDIDIPEGRIIPRELAKYVSLFSDSASCTITITENYLILKYGSINISCRMIVGKVVNYDRLFKEENESHFSVNRDDLLGALIRLGIYSNEENKMTITTEGDLMKMYVAHGGNEGEEVIDIVNPEGIALDVDLNYQVMRTSVSNCKSEDITISQSTNKDFKNIFIRPLTNSKKELWMFAPFGR